MIGAIDRIIEGEQGQTPGLAVAVIRDGQLVHLRGYGVTGVEDANLPVSPDTLASRSQPCAIWRAWR